MNILIGQNIRKVRELRNYTQEYMAEKLGITQNGYSKLECQSSNMTIDRLTQIAEILTVTINDLLEFDENKLFNKKELNNIGGG